MRCFFFAAIALAVLFVFIGQASVMAQPYPHIADGGMSKPVAAILSVVVAFGLAVFFMAAWQKFIKWRNNKKQQ